jgi:hypothetical protein
MYDKESVPVWLDRACSDWLPPGRDTVVVPRVTWAGTTFHAVVELDRRENSRRAAVGLGAVTAFATLDALSTLPLGMEVPWGALDPLIAGYLAGLEEGHVSIGRIGVTRDLRPPLELVGLTQSASRPRDVGRVGIFAHDAPTMVVLRYRPRDVEDFTALAGRLGLGVSLVTGSSVEVLAHPSAPVMPSIRRTRLVEVIYAQWKRQQQRCSSRGDTNEAQPCLELL